MQAILTAPYAVEATHAANATNATNAETLGVDKVTYSGATVTVQPDLAVSNDATVGGNLTVTGTVNGVSVVAPSVVTIPAPKAVVTADNNTLMQSGIFYWDQQSDAALCLAGTGRMDYCYQWFTFPKPFGAPPVVVCSVMKGPNESINPPGVTPDQHRNPSCFYLTPYIAGTPGSSESGIQVDKFKMFMEEQPSDGNQANDLGVPGTPGYPRAGGNCTVHVAWIAVGQAP